MAFTTVTGGGADFVKATDLKVGESLTGWVTGYHNSAQYPDVNSLKMTLEDGKNIILNPAGNLKYFKDDNRQLGVLYRFTRLEDYKTKRGVMSTKFEIEVDAENYADGWVVVPTPEGATDQADIPF